jgi:hypothetical protein
MFYSFQAADICTVNIWRPSIPSTRLECGFVPVKQFKEGLKFSKIAGEISRCRALLHYEISHRLAMRKANQYFVSIFIDAKGAFARQICPVGPVKV